MFRLKSRRIGVVAVCMAAATLLTACLSDNGPLTLISPPSGSPYYDAADPAMAQFGCGGPQCYQIYTTEGAGVGLYNIPGWSETTSGTPIAGTFQEQLLTRPGWAAPFSLIPRDWGPSVVSFQGQYLMAYGMKDNSTGAECVGFGYSVNSSPNSGFNSIAFHICDPLAGASPSYWALDPYLFAQSPTTLYIAWAVEGQAAHTSVNACCGIKIQQLTVTGSGSATTINYTSSAGQVGPVMWNGAEFRPAGPGFNAGSWPYIENPAIVLDKSGGYDITTSMGTWNISGAYVTGYINCKSLTSASTCTISTESIGLFGGESFLRNSTSTPDPFVYSPSGPPNRATMQSTASSY